MPSDPPELTTTPEFRRDMVKARRAKHLTQKQLGARIGTSQNIISLIESGKVETSSYILPICKVLVIAPPSFHQDDDQKQWAQLGHLLRVKNPKQFRRALALVESMLEDSTQAPAEHDAAKDADDRK